MQQLHLVGFTADLEGLIFSAKKGARSGAFVVAMDESLFTALEEARKLVSAAAAASSDEEPMAGKTKKMPALGRTARSSTLSVREIQSRLRAGSSLAEVAEAAGVDEGWIARFAAPVLAEQAAVVSRTLPLVFETNRKGPSAKPLGEAVRWNLADRGIVIDDSSFDTYWSAFQVTPRQWAVRFTYQSRGRVQVAEWEVDAESGLLASRNRLASDLAHVEPGARRRRRATDAVEAQPVAGAVPSAARARKQAARGSVKKKAAPKRSAARPGARGPAAWKAPAKTAANKIAANKTAAKKAPPRKKAVAKKTVAKKTAAKKTAAKKAVAKRSVAKKAAAKASPAGSSTRTGPGVLAPAAARPGTRGVTAAEAAATPTITPHGIGNPGRPNPSPTPYRPTVAARPVPRPAPPPPRPPAEEPADAPERSSPSRAAERPPVRIPAPASVQGQPQRNVVPAVAVPSRPAPTPSATPRPTESGTVRRLPAPSPAAVAMRDQVRPAGGGASSEDAQGADDKPSILVIDAEPAGRRRLRR